MRKRLLTLFLSVVVCICLLTGVAVGETERGDLAERFSDVSRIEYNGTVYSLRNRITTVLFMGIALDEEVGAKVSDLTALVVLDDNEKKITPIRLAGNIQMSVGGVELPLREVYALGKDREESCELMVAAANALLGEELIDDYFAFEIDGAYVVDGYIPVEGSTEAQLRALKAYREQKSLDEHSSQYALLGEYIITDMKSGAVMKIADKTERYEMLHSVQLPTLEVAVQQEDQEVTFRRPDAEALVPLLAEVFYEESKW